MNYDNVITAAALMKGDPRFEEFLTSVDDLLEASLDSFEDEATMSNHALMAYLAGKITTCRHILQVGRPVDLNQ